MTEGASGSIKTMLCAATGERIPEDQGIYVEGEFFSSKGWAALIGAPENCTEEDFLDGEFGKPDIPWRHAAELGIAQAFASTLWAIFRHTTLFFQSIRRKEEPRQPILFVLALLLVVVPGVMMNQALFFWLISMAMQWSAEFQREIQPYLHVIPLDENGNLNYFSIAMQAFILPLQYFLYEVFLATWIQQIVLARLHISQEYSVTLQIRCYSLAGRLLVWIPFVGMFAAAITSVVLNVRGQQVFQRIPVGQALVVGLAPLIVIYSVGMLLATLA